MIDWLYVFFSHVKHTYFCRNVCVILYLFVYLSECCQSNTVSYQVHRPRVKIFSGWLRVIRVKKEEKEGTVSCISRASIHSEYFANGKMTNLHSGRAVVTSCQFVDRRVRENSLDGIRRRERRRRQVRRDRCFASQRHSCISVPLSINKREWRSRIRE